MQVRSVKRRFRAARLAGARDRGARHRAASHGRGASSRLGRLCLTAAAVLALGCRAGGPAPPDGAEPTAGGRPPEVERQVPEEAAPADAAPGTDTAPQPAPGTDPGTDPGADDMEPQAAEAPAVGRDQAVSVARRQVLFTPETELAELAADEEPPVWRVTLRGRRPGGSLFAFEEATVTVDARTGDVLGVETR